MFGGCKGRVDRCLVVLRGELTGVLWLQGGREG